MNITEAESLAFHHAWKRAKEAGIRAGEGITPVPMCVVQRADPLDDTSEIIKRYEPVADGVCGFAWVNIRPNRGKFAAWLRQSHKAYPDDYAGGVTAFVNEHNQSMARKEEHARAMVASLRGEAILSRYTFHAGSRID